MHSSRPFPSLSYAGKMVQVKRTNYEIPAFAQVASSFAGPTADKSADRRERTLKCRNLTPAVSSFFSVFRAFRSCFLFFSSVVAICSL